MKELDNVKKFSEDSKELYTAFKDYADNVLAVDRNVKGKAFSAVSLDAKEKVIDKLFAEEVARRSKVSLEDYEGDIAQYSKNPVVKSFADVLTKNMVDMILPEMLNTSVGLIAEIDYVGFGDVAQFDLESNGLYNVSKAGYRQKNTTFQQLGKQTVTLTPEPRQVSLIATLFDILAGRRSIAKEVIKASKSIEAEMTNEIWDAFTTAVSASTVPSALKITNYAQTSAVTLAEKVTAWNGGAKAVFAGTPLALGNILPADANYRYTLDDTLVRLGYIPNFMTFDVMPTPNFADYKSTNYGLKLPDNKIYVVSPGADKIVKVAVGGSQTYTSTANENANKSETMTIETGWATMAITNAIAGVISL